MSFYAAGKRAGVERSSIAWLEKQLDSDPGAGGYVRARTTLGLLRAFPELRAVDLMGPDCDYEIELKPLRSGVDASDALRMKRAIREQRARLQALEDDLGRLSRKGRR
jgi:hypothetical protein